MVLDVFMFHGELDILELRFKILNNVVDKFVICEASEHLSGEPNISEYLKNKERFKEWEDKIIYYSFNLMENPELVEMAQKSPNTNNNPYWNKVFYMFESMKKPLEICKDDDIIFISDCDEIWNPNLASFMKAIDLEYIYGLKQLVYYYYLNNRCSEPWIGTICLSYKRLKNEVLNHIKQKGEYLKENGGWHFTYQGGEEQMRKKINTTGSGTYYNIPTEQLMAKIKEGNDFFGRDYKFWIDESEWPQYLKDNKEKYKQFCKTP